MDISIETLEETNFGDHDERLRRSHVQVPGETVEEMVARVFSKYTGQWQNHTQTDEVVIRIMVNPDGTTSGEAKAEGTPF